MTHLGSLGAQREADTITFDYFGTEITANIVTDLDYMDFMDDIGSLTPDDPRSERFIKEFARLCIGDQLDTFWTLARRNRQTQTDVFDVLHKIVEASTARPTNTSSDSSDGRQQTEANSTVDSSSLATRLAGRPDLQLVVHQAQVARAAS